MKKAISLINLLEEESLENVLLSIKRYGFDYIEIPLTYVLKKKWNEISIKDIEELRFIIHRSGLKINSLQSISYGIDYDICKLTKDDYDYLIRHFDQVAIYANMLGAVHVVYGSPSTRTGNDIDQYKKFFEFVSSIFSKRGISFCLENNARHFGNNFGYEVESIYKFIDDSKIDNLYSHFDTGNEYLETQSIPNSKYVKSIHISNNKLYNFMDDEKYIKYINNCLKNVDDIESITMENMSSKEDYELVINRFACITKK